MNWQTVGHERIRHVLEQQLATGAFAHAYLFVGPSGVGKRTLAHELAKRLIDNTQENAGVIEFSFADCNLDQVRELIHRLSLRPQGGTKQVAILDAAEAMSLAAANALLKTLEEPAPGTVLIFISSRDNILPTICSRCQVFQFGRLTMEEMRAWARGKTGGQVNEELLRVVDGSPGAYFLAGLEQGARWTAHAKELHALLQGSLAERLSYITEWASEETEVVSVRVAAWLQILYKQPELARNAHKALAVLLEAWQRLQTNANKKLVLQYVCINIV